MTRKKAAIRKSIPKKSREVSQGRETRRIEHQAFFADARHELRTPLNAIIGYCEMLIEDAKDLHEETCMPHLKEIHSAGHQLLNAVNQILDPANTKAEDMKYDVKLLRKNLLNETHTPVNTIIDTGKMLLAEAVDSNLENFSADLTKILSSAERFLMLSDDIEDFSTPEAGGVVADQSTLETTSSTQEKQIGSPALAGRGMPHDKAGRSSLLVVDDNEENRDVLSRHLERQGHSVMVTENGRQALDLMTSNTFDLVLLDIEMPEMNGYEVLQHLKSRYTWRHIPIIMISALDDIDSVIRCIEMGAEDYLTKPFNPVLLKARISACMEKKRLREKEISYLVQIKAILERLNGELTLAAAYVKSLLPAPITEGSVRTDWRFVPSTSLGGDSLGYHWLDEEHFAMYLLDVSGHGVGAALLSVSVINVLRSHSLLATDFRQPDQVFKALNSAFPMELHNNMFFSIWYGVYSRSSRKLAYASAGHPPALLFAGASSGEDQVIELQTQNLFIGGLPNLTFKKGMYDLEGPRRLYVFSDGVYEITKEDGEIWDFEEFVEFMSQTAVKSNSSMDPLLSYVQELSRKEELDDDFSILEVIFE